MTLDEFLERAPAALEAFAAATRAAVEEGDPGFVMNQDKPETDWWKEVAAHNEYVELSERLEMTGRRKEDVVGNHRV